MLTDPAVEHESLSERQQYILIVLKLSSQITEWFQKEKGAFKMEKYGRQNGNQVIGTEYHQ